jgi:hypothetical protein
VSPYCAWHPTTFKRFEESFDTSIGTSLIVRDAGRAYIKPLGNRQGPHVLACEWVGTQLADWFGLPTFDYALLHIDEVDEIPLRGGYQAEPGKAFVTRAVPGTVWGADQPTLKALVNPDDVSALVVFDTWTLNCDRHPPTGAERRPNFDNVFLSTEGLVPGQLKLIAMDHTHCFTCGGDLDEGVARIEAVTDERCYGLFPNFAPFMSKDKVVKAATRLRTLTRPLVMGMVASIPAEWQVAEGARTALLDLIVRRAEFVATRIEGWLAPVCWPQDTLDL